MVHSALARRSQGLIEVGREVAHILKSDREPHAVVRNAKLRAGVRREPLMGGGGGMGGEAFGVAEIVADLEDLQRVQDAKGRRLVALDLERDHRAAARHLALGQRVLRMIGAAGIEHAVHLGPCGEKIGE